MRILEFVWTSRIRHISIACEKNLINEIQTHYYTEAEGIYCDAL